MYQGGGGGIKGAEKGLQVSALVCVCMGEGEVSRHPPPGPHISEATHPLVHTLAMPPLPLVLRTG